MRKKEYYTDLILKYLAGEITPMEEKKLNSWLKENKENQELFGEIKANWSAYFEKSKKAGHAYEKVVQKANIPEAISGESKITRVIGLSGRLLKVAASLSGIVLISFLVYLFYFTAGSTNVVETNFGETTAHLLPDSSKVFLNANSKLEYLEEVKEGGGMEVWLTGEAYFEVKERNQSVGEAKGKFVVHTNDLRVEVLGTTFNVKERHKKTSVVLNSGKVRLRSNLDQIRELDLEPGEMAEISTDSQNFSTKKVNPSFYSSWKEQKLILDDTPLKDIADRVENYFGVQVAFENQDLADQKLTGTISIKDFETFLEVFSATVQAEAKREGNRLILKKTQK